MTDQELMEQIIHLRTELRNLYHQRQLRMVAAYRQDQSMRVIAQHWNLSQPAVLGHLQKAAHGLITESLRDGR